MPSRCACATIACASGCSAPLLQRCGGGEHPGARLAAEGPDVGHRGPALGHRPRLVDDQRRQASGVLERDGVADQHAELRPASGADDDRGRRRESQRAGAGDHQHRDGVDQRNRRIADPPPREREGQHRDRDDDRDEHARHAIGELLDRRLGALRLADQPHDSGEQRRAADAGGPAAQETVVIERPGEDLRVGSLGHRQALAGQHALVDRRRAVDDHTVDRQRFAGAHDVAVADLDLGERHVDDLAAALDVGDRRLQPQQAFQRGRRARPGARFERLAEQHQRDDRGRCLEIDVLVQAEDGDDGTERPGDRRSERDQHVHVRPAAAQRVPCADVETTADGELDGGGKRELQPARQQVLVTLGDAGDEHRDHLQQQRRGQRDGDRELAAQGAPCGLAA